MKNKTPQKMWGFYFIFSFDSLTRREFRREPDPFRVVYVSCGQ